MSFIAFALALSVSAAAPPSFPLVELGVFHDATGYSALVTVAQDGQWVTPNGKGILTLADVAKLKAAAERVVLTTRTDVPCTDVQPVRVVRVARGESRYTRGCGPQAHATVDALVAEVEALTFREIVPVTPPPGDPILVRVDRWRPGKSARKESFILMRSGVWTTDNGVGNTGGQELVDVTAAVERAVLEAPGDLGRCTPDQLMEVTVPGRGSVRWTSVCQQPSPTLQAALDLVFKIVGASP